MSILSLFYRWAIAEGHAEAEPFTYRTARALFAGTGREVRVNLAVRRTPKPHVTIKYLEPDFTALFLNGLRGLAPDGGPDAGYRGRELARNAAVGELALATGLRLQEFTYLLPWEIPPLPPAADEGADPVPGPGRGDQGPQVPHHLDLLRGPGSGAPLPGAGPARDRGRLGVAAAAAWGEPLLVTDPDARGGRVNGVRRRWETLTPAERRRLVAPDGGSCLLAVKNGGGPFTAWATVFERTADRIRARFEPRFPHVNPHRLRHTFLDADPGVPGQRALPAGREAGRGHATRPDAALVFYLSKADPLLVLRDLLGHSTRADDGKVPAPLDTTRIYRDAYEHAGPGPGRPAGARRRA